MNRKSRPCMLESTRTRMEEAVDSVIAELSDLVPGHGNSSKLNFAKTKKILGWTIIYSDQHEALKDLAEAGIAHAPSIRYDPELKVLTSWAQLYQQILRFKAEKIEYRKCTQPDLR